MRHLYSQLLVVLLSIFYYIVGCSPASPIEGKPFFLVIKNINLIDVEAGVVLPSQDVVVQDQLITFVGDSFTGAANFNTTYI